MLSKLTCILLDFWQSFNAFFANSSLESQQSLFLTCFTFLNSQLWPSFFSFWKDDLTSHFIEKIKIMWFDISLRVPCGLGSCSLVNANLSFPPGSCLITSLVTMHCFLTCSFTEKLNSFPIFTQLVNGRTRLQTQAVWLQTLVLNYCTNMPLT